MRTSKSGIKELTTTLTELGGGLGFEVRTRVTEHPKVLWRTTAQTGIPLRLKIEENTHERSPALPHLNHPYAVRSAWWSGQSDVRTFQRVELVATKIRALYQRSKGRDLFDLWLALDQLALDPNAILAAFEPYRPAGLTSGKAIANLDAKRRAGGFRSDLAPLVLRMPDGFDVNSAADRITTELLSRLDANPNQKGA